MKNNKIYFCILIMLFTACHQKNESKQNFDKLKTATGNGETDSSDDRSFRLLKFVNDEITQPQHSTYDFYVVFRSHKWQRNQTIYTIKSYDSIVMITYKEIETNKDDEPLYDSLEKRSIEGIDFKYTTKNKLININSIKGLMDTIMQSTKNLHSYQAVGMHDNYSMHVFINGKDYSVLAEYADGETMLRLDAAFTRSNAFNDLINGK